MEKSPISSPDLDQQNGEKAETQANEFHTDRRKENIIKRHLIDYTSNSNLHGLKYIGERERTIVEKIFWTIMFIVGVSLSGMLIKNLWMKWKDTPVIVTFAEMPTPIWKIPYPAVTICVETKAMQTQFNFTKYYHLYNSSYDKLTQREREIVEDISLVCDDIWFPGRGRNFSTGAEIVEHFMEVSPNKSHFFFGYFFKQIMSLKVNIFAPILTEEGICYTFNTLGAQDLFKIDNIHTDYTKYLQNFENSTGWSLDGGYPNDKSKHTYPYKGLGYGLNAGLSVLMRTKIADIDYICKGAVQGFKIILHNPAEFPRPSLQYIRAPLSQEVIVAIKPKMMTTSSGLMHYDPNDRKCFFQNERDLAFFKVYTQTNCEIECLTNFTNIRCGCVRFGTPYAPGAKVCNAGRMQCVRQAEVELATAGAYMSEDEDAQQSKDGDPMKLAQDVSTQCNCLPACNDLQYEAETSQADYNWSAIVQAFQVEIKDEEDKGNDYARMRIFFKEPQFITSRRSELYGQTDFLANCGGLLGLFLGFSLLSIVEIIYFLTLRITCLWWRRREEKKCNKETVHNGDKSIAVPS